MKMTSVVKPHEVERDWVLIDAEGKTFGRILTEVATLLRGKHKPSFTPNVDCGDYVVIINAKKAVFSGAKLDDKEYFRHSGYFGSTKSNKLSDMLENHTEKLYMIAVRGMLPKNRLGRELYRNLYVYAGSEHKHEAQSPRKIEL